MNFRPHSVCANPIYPYDENDFEGGSKTYNARYATTNVDDDEDDGDAIVLISSRKSSPVTYPRG